MRGILVDPSASHSIIGLSTLMELRDKVVWLAQRDIHLSQATRDKVGTSVAKSFNFQPQPATDMKGVGKMTTYFLDLEVSACGRAGRGGAED